MQKTKTKIEAPPKVASRGKIFLAWLLDLISIVFLAHFASKSFSTFLPQMVPILRHLIIGLIFFIVLMVIPYGLLSQTLGALLLKLKLVNVQNYRRVSYGQGLKHSLLMTDAENEVIEVKLGKRKNTPMDLAFMMFYFFISLSSVGVLFLTTRIDGEFSIASLMNAIKGSKGVAKSESLNIIPQVKKIFGTVLITEKGSPVHAAKVGEILHSGSILETEEKSSALIVFGNNYFGQLRVAAKSRVNIDELMNLDPNGSQKNFFNLVKGSVSVSVSQKKSDAQISVKTKSAVFGVRGTSFSIETNDTYSSILAVKEGSVEAENILQPKKVQVVSGKLLVIGNDGRDHVFANQAIIDRYNWELDSDKWEAPEVVDQVKAEMPAEEAVAAPVDPVTHDTELATRLGLEIEAFKVETHAMDQLLLKANLDQQEIHSLMMKEESLIEADIGCLSAGNVQCRLNMEKTLIRRGYPTTQGTPRLRLSMVDDLRKYQNEQTQLLADKENEIKDLKDVLAKRKLVLDEAESAFGSKTNMEPALLKVLDKNLIRR
jgi:hypothetical protein